MKLKCAAYISSLFLAGISFSVQAQGFLPDPIMHSYLRPMDFRHPSGPLKHSFTIILANDSVFKFKTYINMDGDTAFLPIKRGRRKRKIYPGDTKAIFKMGDYDQKMEGVPADSCWYFKIKEGAINLYATTPEASARNATMMQLGTGPIVSITKDNVRNLVNENERALHYMQANELINAIKEFNKTKRADQKKSRRAKP